MFGETIMITVRLSPEEREVIRASAHTSELSMNFFIIKAIRKEINDLRTKKSGDPNKQTEQDVEKDLLKAEILKLRKILSYVPPILALTAKEAAGYGNQVKLINSQG